MSEDEYGAVDETSYLLRSPESARRLSALKAALTGHKTEHSAS